VSVVRRFETASESQERRLWLKDGGYAACV
jgi:hypothetical protein